MEHFLVTGSIAYDKIAVFPGRFGDHILPDHVHRLNVSFLVDRMTVHFGGTGGNIAYNLALLGEKPLLLGSIGHDFSEYEKWLGEHKVNLKYLKKIPQELTAHATIITDLEDNQIAAFYPGAMSHADTFSLKEVSEKVSLAIIAPNNPKAMLRYAEECRKKKIPFIADPGQAIPALTKENLLSFFHHATGLIANDYEWQMIADKVGWTIEEALKEVQWLMITYGEKGIRIFSRKQSEQLIPAYPAREVTDPTGCGDAFRAGVMAGIQKGYSLERSARLGAFLAAKAVEKKGTQHHTLSADELKRFLGEISRPVGP